MSTLIRCDGCREFLTSGTVEITGTRREHVGGGGIPAGEFHLCNDCAVVAFHAAATRGPSDNQQFQLAVETHEAWARKERQ